METVPRGVPRLVATVAATAARSTLVSSASSNARTPTMGNVTETAASSGVAAPTENATASRNLLTMSPLTSSERMVTSRCSEGGPVAQRAGGLGWDAKRPPEPADTSIAPRSNAAVTAKKTRERVRTHRQRATFVVVRPAVRFKQWRVRDEPVVATSRGCCKASVFRREISRD